MAQQRAIMVVGPDMCGKSQIVAELSRITGIPSFKATSEHDSFLSSRTTRREAFLNQLRYADPRVFDVLKQTGYSIIFDRAYPCERVYSEVLGRTTDHLMLDHMDEMWASIDARIVLCHRSSYAGIVDDLDPNLDHHVLNELHDAYFEFAKTTKCKVLKLNVDDENLDREVSEILRFLEV
jgi:hypothetical protein